MAMSEGRNVRRVKSDNYGGEVLQQLSQLRERSELCDFKVAAGGRVFKVGLWTQFLDVIFSPQF